MMTTGLNIEDFLFVTEVGSRMWMMDDISSDYDLFYCYQTPSTEYLRNGDFENTRAARKFTVTGKEYDAQYMEIGHLVNLLCKGNANAIWAVMSPLIYKPSLAHKKLYAITLFNLSKLTYQSTRGMACSQLSDVTKRAEVKSPQKSLRTCMRTLFFGTQLLEGAGCSFRPITKDVSIEDCDHAFNLLDVAYDNSTLPERPDENKFRDILYYLRMEEIKNDNCLV